MQELVNLVQSLGFPAVICLLFYFMVNKLIDKTNAALSELKTAIAELVKTIEAQSKTEGM